MTNDLALFFIGLSLASVVVAYLGVIILEKFEALK